MRSRISIDVDERNNPIINLEYRLSEDLRDKFVGRFVEEFAHESSNCHVSFRGKMNEGDTDSTVLTIRPIKGNPNRRKELSKHFEKGGGIEFFKNNLETIVINGRTFIKFPYWIEQSRDMLDDMEAHHESNLPEGIQQLLDKHGRFAFDDFQQNNPNMIMSTDRIKENVFNSQNSADKDLLLIKAAHALQKYLGAGTKEKRKEASETAKLVYKQITGKEYENE